MIGYIVISKQDLDIYHSNLGVQVCGDKPTADGQFGAIVEHVVPGSLMNIVCKLKVGDEIVEWNGLSLRNKSKEEVRQIIESTTTAASGCRQQPLSGASANHISQLRLVAVRLVNNG